MNDRFFEIIHNEKDGGICYRSGMMVYEERFSEGILEAAGYSTSGYPLDVLTKFSTRINPRFFHEPSAFNIDIDGQSIDYDLTFVDFKVDKNEENVHSVLTLDSKVKPVRLKVHTVLDGSSMFTRYIEIENLSNAPMNISRLAVLAGGAEATGYSTVSELTDKEKFYSAGYFGAEGWGMEGDFAWHDMPIGKTVIDCRFIKDRFRHPIAFVRNNVLGITYFMQMAWSAGVRFTLEHGCGTYNWGVDTKVALLSVKAEVTGYSPLLVLGAGETYTTPEVYMGAVAGDLDEAVNEMHTHIRRSVLSAPEIDGSECLIGMGMGAEHPMLVDDTKAFIDQMSDMGGEVFILDAGWVCPINEMDWSGYNGLNIPHPDRYPNGIGELVDYCHSKGVKFGLWVEIERLGKKSGLIEKHPDWMAYDIYGKQEPFLDLTNPEAAEWAESELDRIISEYRLDLLRVDYNVSTRNYFTMKDLGSGTRECVSVRHFEAVYAMYGRLKKKYPHVLFENCASGGGRTDLGIMKSFHHTWVSDWQRAPRSVMITNGMTMALPPERVDRLVAGMNCHIYGAFDLHVRNVLLGHVTLNVVAPATKTPNPVQMEFLRHSMDVYKSFIRPILPTAKIYHHTPEAASERDRSVSILEIASPDRSRGAFTVCALANAKADILVRPKGIDVGKTYEVTTDNSRSSFTVSGYELSTVGVRVNIPVSLSSELVLYREV